MKQTFMNEASDVAWLLSTHLRGRYAPPFRSFVLWGNEDSPERLDLYTSIDPNHDDPFYLIDFKEQT